MPAGRGSGGKVKKGPKPKPPEYIVPGDLAATVFSDAMAHPPLGSLALLKSWAPKLMLARFMLLREELPLKLTYGKGEHLKDEGGWRGLCSQGWLWWCRHGMACGHMASSQVAWFAVPVGGVALCSTAILRCYGTSSFCWLLAHPQVMAAVAGAAWRWVDLCHDCARCLWLTSAPPACPHRRGAVRARAG